MLSTQFAHALVAVLLLASPSFARRVASQNFTTLGVLERANQSVASASAAAPCDLRTSSVHIGAGGNAYALQFTKQCGPYERGTVAKVFINKDSRDASLEDMAKIPFMDNVAGLVGDPEQSAFDAECVHADPDRDVDCCSNLTESSTCYFEVLRFGGERTLQSCIGEDASMVKPLITKAIGALIDLHTAGWYHGDAHLENIMFSANCNPGTLMFVDLDGMGNAGRGYSTALEMMFKDYALLLGTCDMGTYEFYTFVRDDMDMDDRMIEQEQGKRMWMEAQSTMSGVSFLETGMFECIDMTNQLNIGTRDEEEAVEAKAALLEMAHKMLDAVSYA